MIDFAELKTQVDSLLRRFEQHERDAVLHALAFAEAAHAKQTRHNGDPYITHPLATAIILLEWNADADTVIAGLLHDTLEDSEITEERIEKEFSPTVARLVDGVTKFTKVDFFERESMNEKIETLRKLFEVMREDIRVVIIKIADRLHNIREIGGLPEARRLRFARETMDVYAKIVTHLGMNDVLREFSDVCMPLLHPEESARGFRNREDSKASSESHKEEFERVIRTSDAGDALKHVRIHPRSLYDIFLKRDKKNHEEHPYTYVIISRDRDACYDLLKVLHTAFRPVSGRFRDYIAVPTESAYQSICTTVIARDGVLLPVRIRTEQMDLQEKQGILLAVFGDGAALPGFSWLARSRVFDVATRESSEEFWRALQTDIFEESIVVHVGGEDVSVSSGSTVLDAAYARYGEEAHNALSAWVNGQPTGFSHSVQEDDAITLKFDAKQLVTRSWLNVVATGYARGLIGEALRIRSRSEKLAVGRGLLQKEFDHFKRGHVGELPKHFREEIAKTFERDTFNDVLSMIGEGLIQARDVLFELFPEKRRFSFWKKTDINVTYPFQLKAFCTTGKADVILAEILALARVHGIAVLRTFNKQNPRTGITRIHISGSAVNRLRFTDFLHAIERQEDISGVETVLSRHQKLKIISSFTFALFVILTDVLLLPYFDSLPFSSYIGGILPLLPIFGVNVLLLKMLQQYFVALRKDRLVISAGFLLNIFGMSLVLYRGSLLGIHAVNILPMLAVFVISIFYLMIRFFLLEYASGMLAGERLPLNAKEWSVLKRRKMEGYTFRFFAVIIWGIQPLYLRYTPANEVSPFLRVFLMCVGIGAISGVLILLRNIMNAKRGRSVVPFRIKQNKELWMIIIGGALFTYFLNVSLLSTTSTNFILFNNFSPVLALLVAAIFWRASMPYLQELRHILWIFCIFLLGSIGSSLIISNSIRHQTGTLTGDIFGVLAMIADTLYVIGQIRYMKVEGNASGLSVNVYVSTAIAVLVLPVLAVGGILSPAMLSIGVVPLLFALGAGVLSGIGQMFNYETFKRIDGFIAFLMFNVSILINFVAEAFLIGSLRPTVLLVIGGCIIVTSTILAEIINSRCQRQGF